MDESITKELTPEIAGSQPATPAPTNVSQSEDPAAELARVKKENEEYLKRIAEKDKHINELSTERATLENRLSGYQAVSSIEEESSAEAPAGQNANQYVRPEDIPHIIERTSFINKVREDNRDIMNEATERVVSQRADQLIRSGKSFNEAVATAVKEERERFENYAKTKYPSAPAKVEVPSSLRGEDGSNPPKEAEAPKETTMDDEGSARLRMRIKRGL